MHLFVDISSHGFGHLAITAPVLNALAEMVPSLQLTIRTLLPKAKLHQRVMPPFDLIEGSTDFGYIMVDATRIDLPASAAAYRQAHADWPARVVEEAAFLASLEPDLVLTNVSYLPLAGAAQAGIPSLSLCSLNWADLFEHYFGHQPWPPPFIGRCWRPTGAPVPSCASRRGCRWTAWATFRKSARSLPLAKNTISASVATRPC